MHSRQTPHKRIVDEMQYFDEPPCTPMRMIVANKEPSINEIQSMDQQAAINNHNEVSPSVFGEFHKVMIMVMST